MHILWDKMYTWGPLMKIHLIPYCLQQKQSAIHSGQSLLPYFFLKKYTILTSTLTSSFSSWLVSFGTGSKLENYKIHLLVGYLVLGLTSTTINTNHLLICSSILYINLKKILILIQHVHGTYGWNRGNLWLISTFGL